MTEWQPIETAPKDETIILGFQARASFLEDDEEDQNRIFTTKYVDDEEKLIEPTFMGLNEWNEIDWCVNYQPTHWMPLPKMPVKKHKCWSGPLRQDCCYEKDGNFYLQSSGNERVLEVTYCPFCGEEA